MTIAAQPAGPVGSAVRAARLADLGELAQLVSPYGVVSAVTVRRRPNMLPFDLAVAFAGGHRPEQSLIDMSSSVGFGRSTSPLDDPRVTAVAEGAERYGSTNPDHLDCLVSSYDDLSGPALDWRAYPAPSAAELADPACHIEAFDPQTPIRWVSANDLGTGEPVWAPAVMACYGLAPEAGERFTYRISTGNAIHIDPDEAILRGLLEVIERDALAVAWLQELPLPRLSRAAMSAEGLRIVDWCAEHFIVSRLFWADLGLGIPLVICVQVAEHDPVCRQVMGAACGRTIGAAAEKAVLEALTFRVNGWDDASTPADPSQMQTILDGARYMAAERRSSAFDFLLAEDGERRVPTPVNARVRAGLPTDPRAALELTVERLAERGWAGAWFDCTSADLADAGLRCVRVMVPDLQPMCLRPPLAFRAHPRLYSAPVLAGFPVRSEEELNRWPHPMA